MDGIFVAYHNTATLFGFQYIPLEEMNKRIFGSTEMAEQAFRLCLALMERTLEVATELFPNEVSLYRCARGEKSRLYLIDILSLHLQTSQPTSRRSS